ncbi:hypothetical protein GOP47_0000633 [Adiantum capillus-veneris]|uniref:Uncharacterized protein n=1 Tax=Adiantum capillus-veneris TaxID=13818 RepID=A0A9D4VDP1_ADICA|nr:hypothetical protein GOP47_0000633 [Adiantum capillus-veneris]
MLQESRGVIVQELTEDFEISSNGASDHHQHIVELPDDSVSLTHQANDQVWQESVYQISRDGMLPSEKTDGRLQNRSFHKCNLHQNGLDNLHYSLAAAKVSAKISKRNSTRIESTCPTGPLCMNGHLLSLDHCFGCEDVSLLAACRLFRTTKEAVENMIYIVGQLLLYIRLQVFIFDPV